MANKKTNIVDELANATAEVNSTTTSKASYVEIELPISEFEQDDWYCCINGKGYQIQRGVKVLVPAAVKEVYDNEQRMKNESLRRMI